MSKKRTSTESANDEQANESSGGTLSQNEDNAKRGKLDLPSDTTLQELPIEILELILIKAVVMEVMDLKLAKCAWKEKADPVISRLKQVCSQWSNILATDHFRTELHRTLDDTAQDTIPLEVLQELSEKHGIYTRTVTLKDETFKLREVRKQYYAIDVYDSDNMEEGKDVIKLPKSNVKCMTACNASNCLYVGLLSDDPGARLSVLRIWKEGDNKFKKAPWKHVYGRSISLLSVTANGCLLTFTRADWSNPASVAIHDANDSLQLEVFLPQELGDTRSASVLQKSNGNLVVSSFDDRGTCICTNLFEITTTGSVVRKYESSVSWFTVFTSVNFADDYDRIMITEAHRAERVELLDSELNLIGVYDLEEEEEED